MSRLLTIVRDKSGDERGHRGLLDEEHIGSVKVKKRRYVGLQVAERVRGDYSKRYLENEMGRR